MASNNTFNYETCTVENNIKTTKALNKEIHQNFKEAENLLSSFNTDDTIEFSK